MNLAWKWIGTFGILATQCGGGPASELSEQADSRPDKGGIDCIGAAFFLEFRGLSIFDYSSARRRICRGDPFLLRVNRFDGTARAAAARLREVTVLDSAGLTYDGRELVQMIQE
jgi:hypothetical protein